MTKQNNPEDVYERFSGQPFWVSDGLRSVGYFMTAMFAGIIFGQFVQITRYAEDGVIPFTLPSYLAEFTPGTILAPLFSVGLIWLSSRHHQPIDIAFQPWLEFLHGIMNDEYQMMGDARTDYRRFVKMFLIASTPLVIATFLLVLHSEPGPPHGNNILNGIYWLATLVSGLLFGWQLRRNPPNSLLAYQPQEGSGGEQ